MGEGGWIQRDRVGARSGGDADVLRRPPPVASVCAVRGSGVPVLLMAGGNAGPDLTYSSPVALDHVAAEFRPCRSSPLTDAGRGSRRRSTWPSAGSTCTSPGHVPGQLSRLARLRGSRRTPTFRTASCSPRPTRSCHSPRPWPISRNFPSAARCCPSCYMETRPGCWGWRRRRAARPRPRGKTGRAEAEELARRIHEGIREFSGADQFPISNNEDNRAHVGSDCLQLVFPLGHLSLGIGHCEEGPCASPRLM